MFDSTFYEFEEFFLMFKLYLFSNIDLDNFILFLFNFYYATLVE
jgi:hypothetical protein